MAASDSGSATNSMPKRSVIGSLRSASSATSSGAPPLGHERLQQVVAERLRLGPGTVHGAASVDSPSSMITPGRSMRPSV